MVIFFIVNDIVKFFIFKDRLGRIVVYLFLCLRVFCICLKCLVVGLVDFFMGCLRVIFNSLGCFNDFNLVVYFFVKYYLKFVR